MLETYAGDVKVVYKNFPLPGHRYARAAAAAALAAEMQGEFWAFHDLLFLNYRQIDLPKIMEIARDLSLDQQRLFRDMNAAGVITAIDRDVRERLRIGVNSTPSVFINGRLLRNRSFARFQADIENILDKLDHGAAISLSDAADDISDR
ncbi:hypothetical protein DSCOOX_58470 [Desulfosarcina ovata subsp. ovata]|uniref:Thioredoxin-like fold domain-containing protein n=1 Tax=Desulfosarcina ovata subsp. ovata TaxID=2752305 RepID=A0A5K8AJ16_9BACT|nr:hypothetical protein DSCOOX_58470 [Desulfosarcina ovata subsp. ovata]